MRFKSTRRGVEAKLDPVEARVLAQCAAELLELLGDSDEVPDDPIAAMVGIASGDVRTPEDPALARLLPDAYADDPDAATDFRRYTEADLRATKRAAASTALAQLQPLLAGGGKLVLDRDECDAWLGWLNDIRLVLGTRLEVTEETDFDDAEEPALAVYGWLGWLQESLLSCLTPRSVT
ncbi:MAG: hypothetical protein JWN77_2016 [Frankiales bacterium]|jgi:hypothetical protein|nr:hypothetical protein [Frankiales bacterium]